MCQCRCLHASTLPCNDVVAICHDLYTHPLSPSLILCSFDPLLRSNCFALRSLCYNYSRYVDTASRTVRARTPTSGARAAPGPTPRRDASPHRRTVGYNGISRSTGSQCASRPVLISTQPAPCHLRDPKSDPTRACRTRAARRSMCTGQFEQHPPARA